MQSIVDKVIEPPSRILHLPVRAHCQCQARCRCTMPGTETCSRKPGAMGIGDVRLFIGTSFRGLFVSLNSGVPGVQECEHLGSEVILCVFVGCDLAMSIKCVASYK